MAVLRYPPRARRVSSRHGIGYHDVAAASHDRSSALFLTTVSLPWYDLAEVRAANDELWRRVALRLPTHLGARAPLELTRDEPARLQWASGRVLLSQACGYDVVISERDRLRLVATPVYRVAGSRGATYRSAVVVRRPDGRRRLEDLRDSRCVYNERWSHSGMNGLRALIAPLARNGRFFRSVEETGSHEASLAAVRDSRADVAAIDAVTLGLLRRHRPGATAGLRVIAWTEPAPAPPFVTDRAADDETVTALRSALVDTLADRSARDVKGALLLRGVEILPLESYRQIAELEARAAAEGYPRLA